MSEECPPWPEDLGECQICGEPAVITLEQENKEAERYCHLHTPKELGLVAIRMKKILG